MKIFKLTLFLLMIVFIGFSLFALYSIEQPTYKYFEKINDCPIYSETIDLGKVDTLIWKVTDKDWNCKSDLNGTTASLDLIDADSNLIRNKDYSDLDVKLEAYSFIKSNNNRKVNRLILNETYISDRPLTENSNNYGCASVQVFSSEELYIKLIVINPELHPNLETSRLKLKGDEKILHAGYGFWLSKIVLEIFLWISYLFLSIIGIREIIKIYRK